MQYTLPHNAVSTKNVKLKKFAISIISIITVLSITTAPIVLPEIFPEFDESIQVVQIMSLAFIPSSLSIVYSSQLLGTERSKIVLFGTIIGITIIITGILVLGKDYGLVGITTSFIIAKIAEFLFLHIKK